MLLLFLVVWKRVSIAFSMSSVAWCTVGYQRALRVPKGGGWIINNIPFLLPLLWRIFEIGPRLLVLSLCMAAYKVCITETLIISCSTQDHWYKQRHYFIVHAGHNIMFKVLV